MSAVAPGTYTVTSKEIRDAETRLANGEVKDWSDALSEDQMIATGFWNHALAEQVNNKFGDTLTKEAVSSLLFVSFEMMVSGDWTVTATVTDDNGETIVDVTFDKEQEQNDG